MPRLCAYSLTPCVPLISYTHEAVNPLCAKVVCIQFNPLCAGHQSLTLKKQFNPLCAYRNSVQLGCLSNLKSFFHHFSIPFNPCNILSPRSFHSLPPQSLPPPLSPVCHRAKREGAAEHEGECDLMDDTRGVRETRRFLRDTKNDRSLPSWSALTPSYWTSPGIYDDVIMTSSFRR